MLQATYHLLLVAAHFAILGALGLGFTARDDLIAVASYTAMLLFSWVALASTNVLTITNDGSRIVTEQPAVGWYAYGLAFISFALAVYATLQWLPAWHEVTTREPF